MAVAPQGSLGTATIRVIANTTEFDFRLRRSLRNLTTAAVGVGAAMAGVNFLGSAIKEAAKLETQFTRIKTIMDSPADEAFINPEALRKLSGDLGVAANDIADSAYLALSSGTAAKDVMGLVEVAAKTALSTGSDTKTVVDALTSSMNAFGDSGMTAAKASDILFAAMKLGKGSMRDFSRYISNAIPVADALGVSLEELSALGAASTLTGKTPRVAFTGLKVAMQELTDATKGGGKVFKEVFGQDFQTYIKNGGSLTEGLVRLGKKVGKGNLTSIFGAKEGAAAIQNLLSLPEKRVKEIVEEVQAAAGTVDTAWGKVENTYERQAAKLREQWKNLKGELGTSLLPVATEVLKKTQDILEKARPAFHKFRDFLADTFKAEDVGVWAETLKSGWENALKPTLDSAVAAAQDAWPHVRDALIDIAAALKSIYDNILPLAQPLLDIAIGISKIAVIATAETISAIAITVKALTDNLKDLAIVVGILAATAGIASFVVLATQVGGATAAMKYMAFIIKGTLIVNMRFLVFIIRAELITALTALRASFIGTWLAALGPIGWVILAIGALIAVFVVLWKKSDAFRNFFKELWVDIQASVLTIIDVMSKAFFGFIKYGILEPLNIMVTGLSKIPFFGGKFDGAKEAIQSVMNDMDSLMSKTGDMAQSARAAAGAYGELQAAANAAADVVYGSGGTAPESFHARGLRNAREDAANATWFPDYSGGAGGGLNLGTGGLNDPAGEADKAAKKAAEAAKKAAARTAKAAFKAASKIFLTLSRDLGKDSIDKIKSQFTALFDKLKEAGRSDLISKLKKFEKAILGLASKRDKVAEKLKEQADALKVLKDAATDFTDGIRSTIMGLADVTKNNTYVELLGPDVNKMISNLQNAVLQTNQLRDAFIQLKNMKLNDTALRSIIEAGPVEGLAAAQAILGGGQMAIDALNQGQKDLDTAITGLSKAGYDQFYKLGISQAEGIVAGLKTQRDALLAEMNALGVAMGQAFRKTIGAKSPSKMFEEIGSYIPLGLAKGIEGGNSAVTDAVNGMNTATDGFSTDAPGGPATLVKVYIGDQELKGMVRTEISERDRTTKARATARSRSGSLYGR